MNKNDNQQLAIQQFAMILNYNVNVEHQHNYFGGKPAEAPAPESKKPKGQQKPPKPRETMTFKHKGLVADGHLSLLFMTLQKAEWIDGNEADFKALFSGKMDEDCVITWKKTFGKSTLVELFKQLVNAGLVIVPDGFTIPSILEGHFKNEEGGWLTGLGKGDKANDKALPMIAKCIKMLRVDSHTLLNGGLDDDDGYDEGYDPFDHQDLQLHKR